MKKTINPVSLKEKTLGRRDFLRGAAAMFAAAELGLSKAETANLQQATGAERRRRNKPDVPVIGIPTKCMKVRVRPI